MITGLYKQCIIQGKTYSLRLKFDDENLAKIGLEFGGRDHSTVIHSCDKITKELLDNSKLQEEINILKDKICEQ